MPSNEILLFLFCLNQNSSFATLLQNFFLNKISKIHEFTREQRQRMIFQQRNKKTKILKITVDYTVKRHQETGQNKTKTRAGMPKATRAVEKILV